MRRSRITQYCPFQWSLFFLCLAEAVKLFFTLYQILVCLNITVPIHFPIFSDSSPNCLLGVPYGAFLELVPLSHTHAPQKTINVYGFVYRFGVAFMVFWGRVYGFMGGAFMVFWGCVYAFGGGVYGFFGGGGLWF